MKINSYDQFMSKLYNINSYTKQITQEDLLTNNLKMNYNLSQNDESLLFLFKETNLFYGKNGFYEIIYENNKCVGGSGVYIKNNIKYIYKRTYIMKEFRKKYVANELFLKQQLDFGKSLITISTYNKEQYKLFKIVERIINNRGVYFGRNNKEQFKNYFIHPIYCLKDMYLINGIQQYIFIIDQHNFGVDKCKEILNENIK